MQTDYTTFMAEVHRRCEAALKDFQAAKTPATRKSAKERLLAAQQACDARYQEWQAEV